MRLPGPGQPLVFGLTLLTALSSAPWTLSAVLAEFQHPVPWAFLSMSTLLYYVVPVTALAVVGILAAHMEQSVASVCSRADLAAMEEIEAIVVRFEVYNSLIRVVKELQAINDL